MLLSSVIHIEAQENGAIPQYLAPALRAEFLNWVGVEDKLASDQLHDGNVLRPYTISDLKGTFRAQKGFNLIKGGDTAWFRVTSLTQDQTRLFQDKVLSNRVNHIFELNKVKFKVLHLAEKHPWAGATSYSALVEKYFSQRFVPPHSLEIEFASPTTFNDRDVYVPLPVPETVLSSWLRKWNAFSSASLPLAVSEIQQAHFALNQYTLTTDVYHYNEVKKIGFKGKCHFRVLTKDEFWLRLCNLLGEYSFYCGTGKSTVFGMGQTRRI